MELTVEETSAPRVLLTQADLVDEDTAYAEWDGSVMPRATATLVEQPTLPPFIAFMVRLPHNRLEDIATLIERHGGPATRWLLAKEKDKEDREHFHGIVFMTDEEYDKVQRHFREVWNLKGQARKGQTKEYGRIRKIKDRNKMLAYTIKDSNVHASSTWDIDLEPYLELSYQKPQEDKKQLREKRLKDKLLEYHKNEVRISTSNIEMMDDDEFSSYQEICENICTIYQQYNFDFPVIKTINKLLIRYGILDVKEAITDHLSRWFSVRDKEVNVARVVKKSHINAWIESLGNNYNI